MSSDASSKLHRPEPPSLSAELAGARSLWGISPSAARIILLVPVVLTSVYGVLLCFPSAQTAIEALSEENQPVELLTFAFFVLGGILSLRVALDRAAARNPLSRPFFFLFGFGLLLIALEEVSWTQTFFQFETPEPLKSINRQNQTSLHNIGALQGRTEYLQLIFGFGALYGIRLRKRQILPALTPPLILFWWFLTITILSVITFLEDRSVFDNPVPGMTTWVNELTECYIAAASTLFVWLKKRELRDTQGDLRKTSLA